LSHQGKHHISFSVKKQDKLKKAVQIMRKGELLSIGEVSKLTGASVKSLRYYERIGILKPAYVDEYSNYRYYTFKQTYLVELITLSIELDIPLKELSGYIQDGEVMDVTSFIAYGKKIAEEKLKTLQEGLGFIDGLEHMIKKQEKYPVNEIYRRKIKKRYYKAIPYNEAISIDSYEGAQLFNDESFSYDENAMPEYGLLVETISKMTKRYAIMEIGKKEKGSIVAPAGEYLCLQSNRSQVDHIRDLFGDQIGDSYLAIEVEIFTSEYNVNQPPRELRVINLST